MDGLASPLKPVAFQGLNRDLVVENLVPTLPFPIWAVEFDARENLIFQQAGLVGKGDALPASRARQLWLFRKANLLLRRMGAERLGLWHAPRLPEGTLTMVQPHLMHRAAVRPIWPKPAGFPL